MPATGTMESLNRDIQTLKQTVEAMPPDDPNRASKLTDLSVLLSDLFEQTGALKDLDSAIGTVKQAMAATPPNNSNRIRQFNNLGFWLGTRYERTGMISDLNNAVDAAEEAVKVASPEHPELSRLLSSFAFWLGERAERTGTIEDLDRAIQASKEAADFVSADSSKTSKRPGYLNSYGVLLAKRFEWTGKIDDLNSAIEVTKEAVDATHPDDPGRIGRLSNLGNWFGRRFGWGGAEDDLNFAIEATKEAVEAASRTSAVHPGLLNSYAAWLITKSERTGLTADLTLAIQYAEKALNATPLNHPRRPIVLNNLAISLSKLFDRTGILDDLNRSIEIAEEALALTLPGHSDRAARLNSLGNRLSTRYEAIGAMTDLNHAIEVAKEGADTMASDHPDRSIILDNLGVSLGERSERTGMINDLNDAVKAQEDAINSIQPGNPDRHRYLGNLANRLGSLFERTKEISYIDRAIEVATQSVEAAPPGHPSRPGWMCNLSNCLGRRFRTTGVLTDIDSAIKFAEEGADGTAPGDYELAARVGTLGVWLNVRFDHSKAQEDFERSVAAYTKGWQCLNASPSLRINLARDAAVLHASQSNWKEASALLQGAVELLPSVSPRSLQHTDKQYMLGEFAGLASMAAATALKVGKEAYHALKLLEVGRGIITGLLLETRTDVFGLEQKCPELAKEFVSLRDVLDSPASEATLLASSGDIRQELRAKQRRQANKRFQEVIKEIRDQRGFQNFLHPPLERDLMAAAENGAIVAVNVSEYRCDAFIIKQDEIKVLPLTGLRHSDIKKKATGPISAELLEWLWETTAYPVLDELGFHGAPTGEWPRIWWIPTGLMSRLPLHGAGRHYANSQDTVLDRVISSYSPSFKALVYARQNAQQKGLTNAPGKALLISMRKTPGNSAFKPNGLRYAEEEVKLIDKLLPPSTQRVKIQQPQREEVLENLDTSTIFHFAGHGISDPLDPSKSSLLLSDWLKTPLTFNELAGLKLYLKSSWLAYLSACSTGQNPTESLQDEMIHLVTACQLAGFPHVIGSLWEVDDEYSVDAAREVYTVLRDKGWSIEAVSLGVHNATRLLRRKTSSEIWGDGYAVREEGKPSVWAAYVHVGP